jgi:hypothetical protein
MCRLAQVWRRQRGENRRPAPRALRTAFEKTLAAVTRFAETGPERPETERVAFNLLARQRLEAFDHVE